MCSTYDDGNRARRGSKNCEPSKRTYAALGPICGVGAFARVLLFLFSSGCHSQPHTTDTTEGDTASTSGSGPGMTTTVYTGSSGGSTSGSGATATTDKTSSESSEATSNDVSSGAPYGCGDGIPEDDVYCFQERAFPEVLCERKVAADFNGDGHLDLAVKLDEKVQFLLGDGSGNLSNASEHSLSEVVLSDVVFSSLDIDADADADLQVVTDTKLFDLRNIGGGSFAQPVVHEFPFVSSPVTLVDVTADGLPDIVTSVFSDGKPQIRVYQHDGNTFSVTPFAVAIPGCYGSSMSVGALDVDTLLDVLVTSSCNSPTNLSPLTTLRNVGDGSLEILGGFEVGRDPVDIALSDIDNDLVIDAVVANQASGDISLMRGLGGGKFAPEIRIGDLCDGCTMLRSIKSADLDGTGIRDEIVATASVGKPSLRMVAVLDPFSPQPTVLVIHQAALSMLEVGDWNEDGVTDIAFSNADLSLGILQSNP